jgi:hypothetical protein
LFSAPEFLAGVALPPWAASPIDFVYKNRQVLESDAISRHLHEWIRRVFPTEASHPARAARRPKRPAQAWKSALPQPTRAVAFAQYSAYFLDQRGLLDAVDLRGRLRQFRDLGPETSPFKILHICGAPAVFCYVLEAAPARIYICQAGRDPCPIECRIPIACIHCDAAVVAWVDRDSVLGVRSLPPRKCSSPPACYAPAWHPFAHRPHSQPLFAGRAMDGYACARSSRAHA